jgi:hypothetical protein
MTAGMKKVVILGATSGIALEVERQLACRGCELLLVARSAQRLAELRSDLMARGAQQVLTCAANLASIQQHASVFEFTCHNFYDFDTVLLAYGSMHEQKDSERSIDVLVEELQINFVSASAILTLFGADLERRRTGCLAAITSVAGDRGRRSNYVYGSAKGALSLFLWTPQPIASGWRSSDHHQARAGTDSDDRSLAECCALRRSGAGRPRHRGRTRTPLPRRALHTKDLALRDGGGATDPGNYLQTPIILTETLTPVGSPIADRTREDEQSRTPP